MPELRKKYDREFRDGAVRIVEEANKPIAQRPRSGCTIVSTELRRARALARAVIGRRSAGLHRSEGMPIKVIAQPERRP
jgi:hypothetical protein